MKATAFLLAIPLLGGCDACERPKPYVPYVIDGGVPDGADAASTKPAQSVGVSFVEASKVEFAAHLASRWKLGGVERAAPAGKTFTTGVALTAGGAIAVARESDSDPGELLFYARGNEQGESLVKSDVVPRSDCDAKSTLSASGQTLLVELGCARRGKPPSGVISRVVSIVNMTDRPVVRASLGLLDPPESPSLSLRVTSPDLDHDGVGDLVLDVALGPAVSPFDPTSSQSIQLRWFDRPAGLSRDLDAAADPFALSVKAVAGKVAKGKDLLSAASDAVHIRNLARAFCTEFGALRSRRMSGDRFECGPAKSLGELPLLLVRAALGRKDVFRAALLLDDVEAGLKLRDVETLFYKLAKPVAAKMERRLAAVPMLPAIGGPSLGPVSFVDDATLLVRTGAGVVRASLATGEEAAADAVPAWADLAFSPNGRWRWTTLNDPCDGSPARATFADASGQTMVVSVPLSGRVQASCPQTGLPIAGVPLSWTPDGLLAAAGGEVIHVTSNLDRATLASQKGVGEALKGAPASADGRSIVWPTRYGLVVAGTSPRIFKIDAQAKARWCTVSPGQTRVACVVGSAVEVYQAIDKKIDEQ